MASRAPAAMRLALVGEGYHVGRAACIGDCLVLQEAQRFEPVEVRSASALAAVRWEVVTRYDPERSDRRERAGFPGVQHVVAISDLDAFALGPARKLQARLRPGGSSLRDRTASDRARRVAVAALADLRSTVAQSARHAAFTLLVRSADAPVLSLRERTSPVGPDGDRVPDRTGEPSAARSPRYTGAKGVSVT